MDPNNQAQQPNPQTPEQPSEQPVPVVQATPAAAPTPPVPITAQPQSNPNQAQTAPPQLPLPTAWPGAFGAYKYSKQAVKINFGSIIGFWVLGLVLTLAFELLFKKAGQPLGFLIGALTDAVLYKLYISGVRSQKLAAGAALSEGLKLWFKMVVLNLLVGITVAISVVLLIIPFFFVLPRVLLAPYFLVDKNMGIIEAYKAGWQAAKGNALKLWGVIGATILMALLMITIIGIPVAIYFLIMYSAAFAVLYEIINRQPTQPIAASPAPGPSPAPAAPSSI